MRQQEGVAPARFTDSHRLPERPKAPFEVAAASALPGVLALTLASVEVLTEGVNAPLEL